ncbi:Uncharacterized membrane protein YgdD, TMEM256/DUF423 family [Andreprevotia lacus DSM 23236]|jgi:uncharacterized membrane protein YgdD (TMEM256/DUF423 family)|uniref:Uncharacterized membrane protein YgdD, TMEM256/DUF423 family n=1 Tax=Andreprevotia lacus DSM 23236 TaxID=1121001 RepID=A0A1W1XHT7_9NEIS|nr:DUF423 domain-containing protein [Andreprevotia lacus]SMC23068.1 Uncharacterized membrane protein YgdD, TMEM256/DUF423 family [Andreprevotia lacus DSM 23236]
MTDRHLIIAAALNMFIGVAAGAFGAHALKTRLPADLLAVWQTAVQYQLLHALGLFVIALLLPRLASPLLGWAGPLMLAGIVLFSGSLYALALSGVRVLGAITPIGGVAFLAAWLLLALAAWRAA